MHATQTLATQTLATMPGRRILGLLHDFRHDRIGLLRRLAERGDLVRFRVGPRRPYMVSSRELAHAVLVEHQATLVKALGLGKFGRPVLGDGLLTAEGEAHARQRRLLGPAFAPRRIAGYARTMAERAASALTRFEDGATIDLSAELMRLTLDVVGRTLFDADLTGDADVIGEALTTGMAYMTAGVSSITFPYSWPTPLNLRTRRAVARLDEVVYRVIAARRAEGGDKGDVLSVLLATRDESDGSGLSDRQVRDETMTLMLAGHETTANLLAWTLLCLMRHPDVHARVEAEVDEALRGRMPGPEDVARLPYALAVLKETMRLYPPAYLVGRQTTRPITLGPATISTGCVVLINIYGMHRRADYFPAPDEFRPERFLGDREKEIPKGAYLPFGAGPRVCIGNHFALMEAQILLATLVGSLRFELARDPDVAPEPLVTLRPKDGIAARVVRRRAVGPGVSRSPVMGHA